MKNGASIDAHAGSRENGRKAHWPDENLAQPLLDVVATANIGERKLRLCDAPRLVGRRAERSADSRRRVERCFELVNECLAIRHSIAAAASVAQQFDVLANFERLADVETLEAPRAFRPNLAPIVSICGLCKRSTDHLDIISLQTFTAFLLAVANVDGKFWAPAHDKQNCAAMRLCRTRARARAQCFFFLTQSTAAGLYRQQRRRRFVSECANGDSRAFVLWRDDVRRRRSRRRRRRRHRRRRRRSHVAAACESSACARAVARVRNATFFRTLGAFLYFDPR